MKIIGATSTISRVRDFGITKDQSEALGNMYQDYYRVVEG